MLGAQSALTSLQPLLVGVTGGGLYNSGLDYNSAAVLKDALPDSFSREGKPDIRILKVTENLPAEYDPSRALIQSVWDGNLSLYDPDAELNATVQVHLLIHMGMRTSDSKYCFETFARKDEYIHPDNCGKLPDREDYYGKGGYFDGCPSELRPELDIEIAAKAVQDSLPGKSRPSTNAGHNLCEWFFYNSLVQGFKRGGLRHVAFIHVPSGRSKAEIETGVEVFGTYVRALADQIVEKKRKP